MKFPVWIDLKGQDSVPDTVHHVVCRVDPSTMPVWKTLSQHWNTDGVHSEDAWNTNQQTKGKSVEIYFCLLDSIHEQQ